MWVSCAPDFLLDVLAKDYMPIMNKDKLRHSLKKTVTVAKQLNGLLTLSFVG